MNLTESSGPKLPTSTLTWFINASEIGPGRTAIIGDNKLAFFAIHSVALGTITVSNVASVIVIAAIFRKWTNAESKLDFPVRFPFYLAIADFLWGLSNFTNHCCLLSSLKYPTSYAVIQLISINLGFFFGYQQLMHASIATYTYLRVVHRKRLNLGTWEWKLHVYGLCLSLAVVVTFYFLKSFGNTGYWMAHDATTINGRVLGAVTALSSTINAVSTTMGYYGIKNTVLRMKRKLTRHTIANSKVQPRKSDSTASKCLTTHVYLAACIYCPLAVFLWVNVLFQLSLGVIEPLSSFLIGVVANSSGWANAYGYFYNEQLKKKQAKMRNAKILQNVSNSDGSTV